MQWKEFYKMYFTLGKNGVYFDFALMLRWTKKLVEMPSEFGLLKML